MGLGESLQNAGLNTLMGMGIVFIVLILISFIISLFKYIGRAEEKISAGKKQETPEPETPEVPEENLADDRELAAVIAAAVAAYEGKTPDGLVVRSIRQVPGQNRWKRG